MTGVLQDLRRAFRSLARAPISTAVAVLTLALGIGVHTAIFSVVDAAFLQSLPYPDSDRLVTLRSVNPTRDLPEGEQRTAAGNLADWQAQARSFEVIAGYRWRTADLTGSDGSERLRGLVVTPEFFRVFGIHQAIGRTFSPRDRGSDSQFLRGQSPDGT